MKNRKLAGVSPAVAKAVALAAITSVYAVTPALTAGPLFEFDLDVAHEKECNAPNVFVPEHRWRVQAPQEGAVAGNVRLVFEEMSRTILERWGPEYEDTLFAAASMSWSDGGQVVEDKMLNAILEQGSFVATFTGNSIAAGHDCLYEQSYPILLNATMGRLMAAAGVGYTAMNVAMGNTKVAPYSYCVDAFAGFDADIISWSFGMEIANAPCANAAASVELFLRSSLVLPRRPAVLVLDAVPNQAAASSARKIAFRNKRFLGDCGGGPSRSLPQVYRDFGIHHMFTSSLILEHAAHDERFSRENLYIAGKHYPRPMSWHPAPGGHELVADMLFMHYGRILVRAAERLERAAPGVSADQLRQKRKKQGGGEGGDTGDGDGRSGGLWTSEGGGMMALREAVGLGRDNPNVIIDSGDDESHDEGDEAQGGGETTENTSHEERKRECSYMGGGRGRGVLPPPEWCLGARCRNTGDYRCATTYFPVAGDRGSRLLDMVVPRVSTGGDLINRDGKYLLVKPAENRWAVTLNEVAAAAIDYIKHGQAPEGFHKPIDTKWVLVGDADSGPIEFEFSTAGVPERRDGAGGGGGGGGGGEGAEATGETSVGQSPSASTAAAATAAVGAQATAAAASATTTTAAALSGGGGGSGGGADSRIAVCRPDFIERVQFGDSSGVRFSIDGVETSVVPPGEDGLATRSCSLLKAEIGPGRHTLRVEPLRRGAPYVAISHLLYPA